MFIVRFDLRNPDWTGRDTAELYSHAVEMASFAEANGAMMAVLSEHHAAPDGHLASPVVLASAIAARTSTLPIVVAALLVPLHDPVRLAEDMVAVDLLSRGRVSYVAGLGYRRYEFEMFGQDMAERGRRMDRCLEALRAAFAGGEFTFEGRRATVTPAPFTPGGPEMYYGGGSPAAARRAARFGMGFFPQEASAELEAEYLGECARLGHEPGPVVASPPGAPTTVFVSDDPDRTWREVGPNMLADALSHSEWMGGDHSSASSHATTVDELREENGTFRVVDVEGAREIIREFGAIQLHPLCGGADPAIGWRSLELTVEEVIPAL